MNNLEKYKQIFMNVFEVEEAELGEDFTFEAIAKWDSVAHLSLVTELENEFDIMLDSDDILHYDSYLNGIEILKKYGVEFE